MLNLFSFLFFFFIFSGFSVAAEFPGLEAGGSSNINPNFVPEKIKIVTWNIQYGNELKRILHELQNNPNLKNADIITLQEVCRAEGTKHQPKIIAKALNMHYVYARSMFTDEIGNGYFEKGQVTLSKYPILNARILNLPKIRQTRIALVSDVKVKEKTIQLFNIHLENRAPIIFLSSWGRKRQMKRVLEEASKDAGLRPQIILGDFNTIDVGGCSESVEGCISILKRNGFAEGLENNCTSTHCLLPPFICAKLDWVFLKGLRVINGGVEKACKASDHRPVWVDIEY